MSVSRFFYATAREHALPPVFSRISMRYMTPWVACIGVFVVGYASSLVILYTRSYLTVIDMMAATECVIYVLSAAALVVLRKKLADTPRPFKVPFGSVIPVVAILVFAFLAVATIATDPAIGVWMAVGLAVIGLYVVFAVPRMKEKYRVKRTPRTRRGRRQMTGRPRRSAIPRGPAPGRRLAQSWPSSKKAGTRCDTARPNPAIKAEQPLTGLFLVFRTGQVVIHGRM